MRRIHDGLLESIYSPLIDWQRESREQEERRDGVNSMSMAVGSGSTDLATRMVP